MAISNLQTQYWRTSNLLLSAVVDYGPLQQQPWIFGCLRMLKLAPDEESVTNNYKYHIQRKIKLCLGTNTHTV